MFNAFQWNCFNLVDTCDIALQLFLKCDITKFWIPPSPMSHNVTLRRPPPPPLTCDVIYGCPLFWNTAYGSIERKDIICRKLQILLNNERSIFIFIGSWGYVRNNPFITPRSLNYYVGGMKWHEWEVGFGTWRVFMKWHSRNGIIPWKMKNPHSTYHI